MIRERAEPWRGWRNEATSRRLKLAIGALWLLIWAAATGFFVARADGRTFRRGIDLLWIVLGAFALFLFESAGLRPEEHRRSAFFVMLGFFVVGGIGMVVGAVR